MPEQPLTVLLQVRRLAVDQARQSLADCLSAEAAATETAHAIATEIAAETAAATVISADDVAVEGFAQWLRRMLPRQRAAEDALLAAELQTREARAVLAATRAGVRAIETLLAQRAAERQAEASRQEQARLDEVAQRAGPHPR